MYILQWCVFSSYFRSASLLIQNAKTAFNPYLPNDMPHSKIWSYENVAGLPYLIFSNLRRNTKEQNWKYSKYVLQNNTVSAETLSWASGTKVFLTHYLDVQLLQTPNLKMNSRKTENKLYFPIFNALSWKEKNSGFVLLVIYSHFSQL